MKDFNGDIVLFNVKSLNTTVLAKNTTQVSFYFSNKVNFSYNLLINYYGFTFITDINIINIFILECRKMLPIRPFS